MNKHNTRDFIIKARWKETNYISPHAYTHIDWNDRNGFLALAKEINTEGEWGVFRGNRYKYLSMDGYKYWIMYPVINRAKEKA